MWGHVYRLKQMLRLCQITWLVPFQCFFFLLKFMYYDRACLEVHVADSSH